MGTLKYSSNNSGGSWWLRDSDWKALEEAGWKVRWVKDEPETYYLKPGEDRWLGALAKYAEKEFDSPETGVAEWEELTGGIASDQGCNCCGSPHSFEFVDENGDSRYYETYTQSYGGW